MTTRFGGLEGKEVKLEEGFMKFGRLKRDLGKKNKSDNNFLNKSKGFRKEKRFSPTIMFAITQRVSL